MRDILDPSARWLGTPAGALVFGNKAPVALDDALTVLKDSGSVSIAVLGNDYDPEGGALTLISASAALGAAVAETDGTVTYTPPPGISGFDTVVYEIADPLDQRRTAQVDITITDPQLSIDRTPGNTLTVTATGVIDITVTEPATFAGTYGVDTAALAGGPLNLVPPAIAGTPADGAVLNAAGGLWVHETGAGVPSQGWQWQRGGADIPGATGPNYTVTAADLGQNLAAVETLGDAFGQRSAASAPLGSSFSPAGDTALIGWWAADDAATIAHTGGVVSAWTDKAGGAALQSIGAGSNPSTGTRTLNGLNALDFTGAAFLEAPRALPLSGDVAVHMVLAIDGSTNAFEAILAFEATNNMQIDAGSDTGFDGRLNLTGVGSAAPLSGGPFSGGLILSAVFDRTGTATAEIFIGGVSRVQTAYTAPLDASPALHLMANRTRNAFADGAVAELILTGDTGNRAAYHAYLSGKWGLS